MEDNESVGFSLNGNIQSNLKNGTKFSFISSNSSNRVFSPVAYDVTKSIDDKEEKLKRVSNWVNTTEITPPSYNVDSFFEQVII